MGKKEKRIHRLEIRLTEDEHGRLEETTEELGIDKSELVRKLLFRGEDTLMVTNRDFRLATDRIGTELGKIGSNVNQFARYVNLAHKSNRVSPELIEGFNELLLEYKKANTDLVSVFDTLLRSSKI